MVNTRYVGVVTDRSWVMNSNRREDALAYKTGETHLEVEKSMGHYYPKVSRRIYADEVPMADEEIIYNLTNPATYFLKKYKTLN